MQRSIHDRNLQLRIVCRIDEYLLLRVARFCYGTCRIANLRIRAVGELVGCQHVFYCVLRDFVMAPVASPICESARLVSWLVANMFFIVCCAILLWHLSHRQFANPRGW